MLASSLKPQLAIVGIDQQNFDAIQLISGCFPFQNGLQMRMPGHKLEAKYPNSIGSILVFYSIYGRPFTGLNFGDGTLQIIPTEIPRIVIPARPPTANLWYDDFAGYELGLISRLWGAGIWTGGIGVCESIIEGIFDPFLVYAVLNVPNLATAGISTTSITHSGPTEGATDTATIDTGSAKFHWPKNPPDIVLIVRDFYTDESCHGQGLVDGFVRDSLEVFNAEDEPSGVPILYATDLIIGQIINHYGIKVGRASNSAEGLHAGVCPTANPPGPFPISYYLTLNDGQFGPIV